MHICTISCSHMSFGDYIKLYADYMNTQCLYRDEPNWAPWSKDDLYYAEEGLIAHCERCYTTYDGKPVMCGACAQAIVELEFICRTRSFEAILPLIPIMTTLSESVQRLEQRLTNWKAFS